MSVAFKPGQVLTENDLKITIRNSVGTPVDPVYIRYSLFDNTTGIEVLIGPSDRIPATSGTGQYYVDATIPLDSNVGDWLVRWNFRELSTSPLVEVVQEFNVVKESSVVNITGSDFADAMLRRLRILLRDNNPDRNYRFRPPNNERFLQAQAQVFNYIWEDEELYEYLLMAVDDFNAAPPVTGITVETMPPRWRTAILLRAGAFACFAVAMNWIADEFSVDGNERVEVRVEEGDVLNISLRELYDLVYSDRLKEIEKEIKEEYHKALKEISDEDTVLEKGPVEDPQKIVEKNEVNRVRNSFLRGTLEVKSVGEPGKVAWKSLKNVMKHSTGHKKTYRVVTNLADVVVTEDHSLFLWDTKEPIESRELRVGDLIVGSLDSKELTALKISDIIEEEALEESFDLSVPETENFLLASGILAHNSYSISGVSLDVEKSSKYESMKNNFIQEYDKARDLAKRSIKIVKGLKQPRYGVGISSALGPFSRPGVQSRRNWVSGGNYG